MTQEIVAIDMERMLVMNESGFEFPITNRFDCCGDDTDDWRETRTIVAGPDDEGKWWGMNVTEDTRKPN